MKDRPQWENAPPPVPLDQLKSGYQDWHKSILDAMTPEERARYDIEAKKAENYMRNLRLKDGRDLGVLLVYLIVTIWATVRIFMAGYTLGGFLSIILLIVGFFWIAKKQQGN